MNRKQFVKVYHDFIKEYNLPPEQVHCSHGGAMLLMGLRKETEDLDLTVSNDIWFGFVQRGFKVDESTGFTLISINEYVDIHLADEDVPDSDLVKYDKYIYYRNAKRTLRDKLKLNRPKDQESIKVLRDYLAKHK